MQELGGELDFATKPFDADVAGHIRRQNLHHHTTAEGTFVRNEDSTHSAAGELTLERVPAA
jgi:hypothetical protein